MKNLNFSKLNGLIPAIIQDSESLEILMIAFMNQEALEKTIKNKKVTFFSRSKNRLWEKGETSGNFLELVDIKADCDNDSLVIFAKAKGPTCHTGKKSCFGENNFNLLKLFKLIKDRKRTMPKNSYTSSLFNSGLEKIIEKIEEESEEVVVAAKSEGKKRLIEESCDLIYHLFVLLNKENISISDINEELAQRNRA